MELNHSVSCYACDNEIQVSVQIPASAWEPNGARWDFTYKCDNCEEELVLSAIIESSIE